MELGVTRDAGPLAARPSATGRDRAVGLDGLRAVAVLLVLAFHFGVGGLEGGFFGVDVFFVLSGFLITGLLVGEFRGRGRIGLAGFWLRRARRLLPALIVVLVVVSLVVRFAEPAGQYPDFRMSVLSSLGYFSNWWQIATSGSYFTSTSPPSPLTHIWSLAVEEQFYLVWPFVVLAVMSLSRSVVRGVRALLVVSVAGALASALEMALLYNPSDRQHHPPLLRDRHPRPVHPGRCGAGLRADHRPAAQGTGGDGPGRPQRSGPPWRGASQAWPAWPCSSSSPAR